MGLLLVRLAEAMLLKLPLPLLLFDPQGKYPHHLYNKNFRMENVPLLCDLAAAIALIQEWFFLELCFTGHSLSAPQQTHLTWFQLNPVSRAHQAETLD